MRRTVSTAIAIRTAEQGSTLVEFLFVFPAFLVLSLFVLEVGLMWGDRHIARLAAFEAARVFASANLPEFQDDGTSSDDPCLAGKTKTRAQQAALRKIAIVSPPIGLFISKLGKTIKGLDAVSLPQGSLSVDALKRLALRWPTAVASTKVHCTFDREVGRVSVELTYNRMLQTPFIDRIMYVTYHLAGTNTGPLEIGLDQNFYGLSATLKTPGAVQELKKNLGKALATVQQINMPLGQATSFLKDVPGVGALFASLPGVPSDVTGNLISESLETNALVQAKNEVTNTINDQSKLLMTILAAIPEALRTIPIKTNVALQRDAFTANARDAADGPKERRWDGVITGVMKLEGDHRTWGRNLSEGGGDLGTGAKPVEGL